jgi:hypothetical protein
MSGARERLCWSREPGLGICFERGAADTPARFYASTPNAQGRRESPTQAVFFEKL